MDGKDSTGATEQARWREWIRFWVPLVIGVVGLAINYINILRMSFLHQILVGLLLVLFVAACLALTGAGKVRTFAQISVVVLVGLVGVWEGWYWAVKDNVILTDRKETFYFDDGTAGGWSPWSYNNGSMSLNPGKLEVTGTNCVGNHCGPFLKYPLYLKSDPNSNPRQRGGVYRQMDGAKITGILASVYYESDDGYGQKTIEGGFAIEKNKQWYDEWMIRLQPNQWNTVMWSLYSPVWWNGSQITDVWNQFRAFFPTDEYLYPGYRLDDSEIERIGIQFHVRSGANPEEFRGTVYIDNIIILHPAP